MKSFESEVMDLGYYSEEEITREEYESMSDNARENLAIKRFEDVSGVSVTKFYLKKKSWLAWPAMWKMEF